MSSAIARQTHHSFKKIKFSLCLSAFGIVMLHFWLENRNIWGSALLTSDLLCVGGRHRASHKYFSFPVRGSNPRGKNPWIWSPKAYQLDQRATQESCTRSIKDITFVPLQIETSYLACTSISWKCIFWVGDLSRSKSSLKGKNQLNSKYTNLTEAINSFIFCMHVFQKETHTYNGDMSSSRSSFNVNLKMSNKKS